MINALMIGSCKGIHNTQVNCAIAYTKKTTHYLCIKEHNNYSLYIAYLTALSEHTNFIHRAYPCPSTSTIGCGKRKLRFGIQMRITARSLEGTIFLP